MQQISPPSRRQLLQGRFAAAETHICSMVVHCHHDQAATVERRIGELPGAEIHARQHGKLIVTIETRSDADVVERMNAISLMEGVLSTALVYHHVEPDPAQG